MIIGIQGGKGSFNEQALEERLSLISETLNMHQIEYLFTSDVVLQDLENGKIDRGQFAVVNSLAGPVKETVDAKEKYKFDERCEILSTYRLKISHCLMVHPETDLSDIAEIKTHPHVILQCRGHLTARFPQIKLVEGEGKFKDPARVGQAIATGELPRTIATVSSSRIADAFGLRVLAVNLQDRNDNYTDFEFIKLKNIN